MCGIAGIYCKEGVAPHALALRDALKVSRHRGPDGDGIVFFRLADGERRGTRRGLDEPIDIAGLEQAEADVGIGHLRLSILDLSDAGRQPMRTHDGRVWITYNGEVYNYIELKQELEALGHTFRTRTDTEVILAAYRAWGTDCVKRFNGMWAFCIVDLERRILFCSRDRFGVKPFHYWHDGTRLVFASEIKQLLSFSFVPRRANRQAVYEFLAYAAVDWCEETFYDGIYKLLQGHSLIFHIDSGSIDVERYYEPPVAIQERMSYRAASQKFRELLHDSVRLRLRSDVPVGTCLSGGLDSSAIVCLMNQLLAEQERTELQRTFSSHFDDKEANEIEYMQHVIEATKVDSHVIRPQAEDVLRDLERVAWHQDEPFGSTSIFAQWFVYKCVRENSVIVMLDGQGADEVLGGYVGMVRSYHSELEAKKQKWKLRWEKWRFDTLQSGQPWYRNLWSRGSANGQAGVVLPSYHEWIRPELVEGGEEASHFLANQRLTPYGEQEHFNNLLYQFTFHNNLQQLLRYQDRNSMAWSIESRVPFLDYRLVEHVIGLPSGYKVRNGYTKSVLREGMRAILPEKIRTRVNKLGFATPEARFQRTVLRDPIRQAIGSERMKEFLVPEVAQRYFDMVLDNNRTDFGPWRMLSVWLWMERHGVTL